MMQAAPFQQRILHGALSAAFVDERRAAYAIIDNPMQFDIGPDDLKPVPEGATVHDLVPAGPWLCQIDGQYISRADWWQPIRTGECVIFHQRPQGKDGLRAILMIAVIVASIYTGGAAGAAYFGSATTAQFAGALVGIVGSLLVNALVPMEVPQGPSAGVNSPNYDVALQGNSARLDQAIPVLYGHNKTFPDFAAQPYTINDNSTGDQFYHFCICIGQGQYQVLRVSVDDTPMNNFTDVEYKVIGPGQADGETLNVTDSAPPFVVIDAGDNLAGWTTSPYVPFTD